MQRLTATRAGSWFFSHTLHHFDRVLKRLSGGRITAPQVLGGTPVIWISTTGAKSGETRTVPVLGFQDGADWVVVASNWGSDNHPAWYYNLRTNPEVRVEYQGQTSDFVADEVDDDEWDSYWSKVTEMYVGYDAYRRRSGDRNLPIVVLRPD